MKRQKQNKICKGKSNLHNINNEQLRYIKNTLKKRMSLPKILIFLKKLKVKIKIFRILRLN